MASRQQRNIPHVRDVFQSTVNQPQNGGGRRGSRPLAPLFGDRGNQHGNSYEDPSYAYAVEQKIQHRVDEHYGNYGRTLTEKDVKHIERHLSMKKTIRKQLSRHLTQSYLDAESNDKNAINPTTTTTSTSTRATSESNFLELLKDVRSDDRDDLDRDSGHCSPIDDLDVMQSQWHKNFGGKHSPPKKNNNDGAELQESKKSSLWKKLTVRAKIKH